MKAEEKNIPCYHHYKDPEVDKTLGVCREQQTGQPEGSW